MYGYNGHCEKLKGVTPCFVWGRGALTVGSVVPKLGGIRGVEILLLTCVYDACCQGGDIASTTTYVDFRTEDGTANAGSDFVFASGTLIFQPGETQRHIDISIIDDDVFEEDEHFFVNLNNARNERETPDASGD